MRGEIGTLYSDLCRRVHPDRFVGDDEKIALADKLFKQVQESKADYQKLLALKDEVDKLREQWGVMYVVNSLLTNMWYG